MKKIIFVIVISFFGNLFLFTDFVFAEEKLCVCGTTLSVVEEYKSYIKKQVDDGAKPQDITQISLGTILCTTVPIQASLDDCKKSMLKKVKEDAALDDLDKQGAEKMSCEFNNEVSNCEAFAGKISNETISWLTDLCRSVNEKNDSGPIDQKPTVDPCLLFKPSVLVKSKNYEFEKDTIAEEGAIPVAEDPASIDPVSFKDPFAGLTKIDNYKQLKVKSVPDLIGNLIKTALGFVGSIALVMFVGGGLLWMTAMGNAERQKKAMNMILWSSLGVLVILSSYVIVSFVLRAFGVS